MAERFWLDMPRVIKDFVTVAIREVPLPAYGDRVADEIWPGLPSGS